MQIWHDNTDGSQNRWYLNKILLVDPLENAWWVHHFERWLTIWNKISIETCANINISLPSKHFNFVIWHRLCLLKRVRYLFRCDKWLSSVDSESDVHQTLVVSCSHSTPDAADRLKKNLSQRMLEDHMWLSVGYRSNSSKFTRAQRLGSCLATLFLFMITNAMFFKDASEQQPSPLIMLGPISITGTQLYNSLMTSLIIFPPILLLVFIFSHSRPRYEDFLERSKGNRKFQLPFWCCYIGWFLVFIFVLVSAVFTIFYSMSWGKAKSIAWIQAFALTVLESILLVQPIKVCRRWC